MGKLTNNTPPWATSSTNPLFQTGCIRGSLGLDPPMRPKFPLLTTLLAGFTLLMASSFALAGDGKQKHTIAFHAEGNPADGAKRSFTHPVAGEMKSFQMTPTITQMDFAGFVPFRAEDGSFAAAFILDEHGALKLNQLTAGRKTTNVVASVDMKPVDVMVIDREVKDGIIVLWKGLGASHIEYLEKQLKVPVIREPGDLKGKP